MLTNFERVGEGTVKKRAVVSGMGNSVLIWKKIWSRGGKQRVSLTWPNLIQYVKRQIRRWLRLSGQEEEDQKIVCI